MAIEQRPATYCTSDGREFPTQAEAERYETVVQAQEAFAEARHRLGVVMAEASRTADGEVFDFSLLRDYYTLSWWCDKPGLREVSFGYGTRIEFDEFGEDILLVENRGAGPSETRHRIGDLYARKQNAERALLTAKEKWLAEETAAVVALRERLEKTNA